jgi:hypothetical protein
MPLWRNTPGERQASHATGNSRRVSSDGPYHETLPCLAAAPGDAIAIATFASGATNA